MIRIHKGPAPVDLVRDGERHAQELCAAYEVHPDSYLNGEREMAIADSIYKSGTVKAALEACHHGKCCYCETDFSRPCDYPHVEHWRPQSSSRQGLGEARVWPGYYWLAYSWDNLLWSCAFCNLKKSDLFPLENPTTRARHHGMPLENETPAILKPDGDQNPRDHITFHMEVPVGLTALGRKTIEVLRLDSSEHEEARRTHLNLIQDFREAAIDLMDSDDPNARQWAEHWREIVEESVRPEKPYSAMVAAYLEAKPLPDRPA